MPQTLPEPWAIALLFLVLALASFARGYSGFGYSALLVSGGSLVVEPQRIIPVAMAMEVIASLLQMRSVWHDVDWRRLWLLMAGSLIGTPPGVLALAYLDPAMVRLTLSLYVIAMSGLMLAGWRLGRPLGDVATFGLGVVCGLITGLVAMGGLFVVLLMTADGSRHQLIRATMIAYFLPLDAYTAGLFAWQGLYGRETLLACGLALPVLLAGMVVGGRSFLATSPETFRRYTLGLLLVLGLAGILRAMLVP